VLYLQGKYAESVADCATTLDLQPFHFGAASGAGLCFVNLRKLPEAAAAFERALAIHPGLGQIEGYLRDLRAEIELSRKEREGGGGGPRGSGEEQ